MAAVAAAARPSSPLMAGPLTTRRGHPAAAAARARPRAPLHGVKATLSRLLARDFVVEDQPLHKGGAVAAPLGERLQPARGSPCSTPSPRAVPAAATRCEDSAGRPRARRSALAAARGGAVSRRTRAGAMPAAAAGCSHVRRRARPRPAPRRRQSAAAAAAGRAPASASASAVQRRCGMWRM